MLEFEGLVEEIKDQTFSIYKIKDICEVKRGRVILKKELQEHPGIYPVYSSATDNDGIMGYLDTYDYDGEYITWTVNGNAGTVFYRTGKFNSNYVSGLLKVKVDFVNPKWLYYYLSVHLKDYVNNSGIMPTIHKGMVEEIKINIPSINVQNKIVHFLDVLTALITTLRTEEKKRKEKKRKEKKRKEKNNIEVIAII